ncbi:MAG: DUF6754 domain-containing protein [Anaerolineae bacterium]|jgi:hypothetical protein
MNTTLSGWATLVALVIVLGIACLLWWFTWKARDTSRGARSLVQRFPFRRIRAFEALSKLLDVSIERGKIAHVSLGDTGIGGSRTATILSGLTILRYIAERGAAVGSAPTVTVADPTLLFVAQDVVHDAHKRVGRAAGYHPTDVQLIAPNSTAYAIGAVEVIRDESVATNVMTGPFGDEYLLLAEPGAQRGIAQVAGSDSLNAQPYMSATADPLLIGEELFAAGAYLTDRPEHKASLWIQDILRLLIVAAIVIGILVATLTG